MGSVSAAALVAILVIPGGDEPIERSGDASRVSALYSQFGSSWQVSPSTLPDMTIRGAVAAKDQSVQQQALSLGLKDGVTTLGEGFPNRWLPQVEPTLTAEQVLAGSEAAYYELGQLAAIARFQCQLEGEEAFFLAAQDLMDELAPALEDSESDYGCGLYRVIEQPDSASVKYQNRNRNCIRSWLKPHT